MPEPLPKVVLDSLERILASPLFAKADRQSRFLRYIVERHLAGDDESLRETSIGLEVYQRPAAYDPKSDPIVRVEASRLRSRLREFYETEGAELPVRIDIPKGSYIPSFILRSEPVPVEAATTTEPSPPAAAVVVPTRRTWIAVTAGIVAILVAGAVFWLRPTGKTKPIDSIAVLPFSDLSEKKELGSFTQRLTEEIQDELTRIRELRVMGSASSKQAALNPDIRAAAHELGADAILTGSVRVEQKTARVTVRLYDGSSGSVIWSGSFSGNENDVLSIEEQVARALSAKLEIQLAVRREGVEAKNAPQRAQAHEYYEQARAIIGLDSVGSPEEPYRLLQLAAATDPTYAPTHAALASLLIATGGVNEKTQALAEMNKALELDPDLPRAHAVRIVYYRDIELNWIKAREACTSSLKRLPNVAAILTACASVEGILLNRTAEEQYCRRAVALDPLSGRAHLALMFALYRLGQFDQALGEADTALRLGPVSYIALRHRALILAAKGDLAGGLETIDGAHARLGGVPEDWMTVRGYILGRMDRREETEQLIREYKGVSTLNLGTIYLGLGDMNKALDYFERGLTEDPAGLSHVIPQYYSRTLDGNPRFEALKQKLGIPAEKR